MPIGDLTQIHFAAEGKNHADQRRFKNHFIRIGSTTDTSPGQGGDSTILGGSNATGACGYIHLHCHRSTSRCRLDASTRDSLSRLEISGGLDFFSRDSELSE
jgi:hypothetical protein